MTVKNTAISDCSFEIITGDDLRRLLVLAQKDFEDFLPRYPNYKHYEGTTKIVALCQGAAQHYVDRKNGVKDFDVWSFFPKMGKFVTPRRVGRADFGESKFGKRPKNTKRFKCANYRGRRIDFLWRADDYFNKGEPQTCIRNYLQSKKSGSPKFIAEKPVIGLYPESVFAKVLWTPSASE